MPQSSQNSVPVLPKLSLDEDDVDGQSEGSVDTPVSQKDKLNLQSPLSSHVYIVYLILHLCYEVSQLHTR